MNRQPLFGQSRAVWGACVWPPGWVLGWGGWWLQEALSAGRWAQPPPGGGPLGGRWLWPWP